MLGIGKLERILGAVIWDVLDEAGFGVVDTVLHELEIVHCPSWQIGWHGGLEFLEFLFVIFWHSFTCGHYSTSSIRSIWNTEHSPSQLALLELWESGIGLFSEIKSHSFYFFGLYFYN